jgi:signal transduction histidine kinase
LNNLSTAIAIYGPNKQIDYFNQAFADLWRLESDWLATKPSHTEVLEKMRENRQLPEHADFPAYREQLFRHYTDLIEPAEELIYKPDGRILRRIVTPHPFGGLMFVEEDVTDSLALERSYNTLIATQSETLDNLYEGVAVYGGDGRLKLFNPAFADIWHLSEDMLESEPHIGDVLEASRGLFRSDDWPSLKQELVAHATGRERHALRFERSDQSTIDYGCVALPDGNALLTYVDITDTATIERALRERNAALEEADRLKTEFIANMSYELRTPLNSIIGFTDMLSNQFFGELNERQFEYVGNIREASADLRDLINGVLDLASIEADRMELSKEAVDIYQLIDHAVSLVGAHARRKELEIESYCAPTFGLFPLDEVRVRQVLVLLLTNAIDYTQERGRVGIGARLTGQGWEIWVEDNGVGIDPADHQRVFEKFQHAEQGGAHHSVGLGLSLVKSIIELHGGTVELTSQIGVGTRISIQLPRDNGDG